MSTDPIIFAGVDVSSGRKPVTFAALDNELKILALKKLTLSESISCLREYESILLVINSTSPATVEFKKMISQAGFKQASRNSPRQWMEADAQQSFLAFCEHELLSRRTLEGRIQRALILYDEGLHIPDPMNFFEEITRHKLMQGTLPLENVYSVRELDALMAAQVAWMFVSEPRQIRLVGNKATVSKAEE